MQELFNFEFKTVNYLTSFLSTYASRSLTSCVCRPTEKLYNGSFSSKGLGFLPFNYDPNNGTGEVCPCRLKTSDNCLLCSVKAIQAVQPSMQYIRY